MSDLQLVILIVAILLIALWHMRYVSEHITVGFSDLKKCALDQTEKLNAIHNAIERCNYSIEFSGDAPKKFQESILRALHDIQTEIWSAREGIEAIRNSADRIADNTTPNGTLAAGL